MRRASWLAVLLVALAPAAPAVLVDSPDSAAYERPPADDPGWDNVGRRGPTSAIYLGDGWVLTARHSSVGAVEFGGRYYAPVEGSLRWIEGPDGTKADLIVFRVFPEPELPPLQLRRKSPEVGAPALLVGYGQGRGGAAYSGPGFRTDGRGEKRWGSNTVDPPLRYLPGPNQTLTRCFAMKFSRGGSPHEAQATQGDSGGAVFVRSPGGWRLAGVMIAVGGQQPNQAPNEALYGNLTHAVDLSLYATHILESIGRKPAPEPRKAAHELR